MRAAERSVAEAGAVAVLGDLIDRYSAASGRYVTPARIAEFMVSLAAIGEGTTVLDPASGIGELLAAALARGAGRVLALRHFDWLDAPDARKPEARRPPTVWPRRPRSQLTPGVQPPSRSWRG